MDQSLQSLLAEDAVVELRRGWNNRGKRTTNNTCCERNWTANAERDLDLAKRLEQNARDMAQLLELAEVDSESEFVELAQPRTTLAHAAGGTEAVRQALAGGAG